MLLPLTLAATTKTISVPENTRPGTVLLSSLSTTFKTEANFQVASQMIIRDNVNFELTELTAINKNNLVLHDQLDRESLCGQAEACSIDIKVSFYFLKKNLSIELIC